MKRLKKFLASYSQPDETFNLDVLSGCIVAHLSVNFWSPGLDQSIKKVMFRGGIPAVERWNQDPILSNELYQFRRKLESEFASGSINLASEYGLTASGHVSKKLSHFCLGYLMSCPRLSRYIPRDNNFLE